MQGTIISKLFGALGPYGFIRGEDGIDRFFVPSSLVGMEEAARTEQFGAFDKLEVGNPVEFAHIGNVKGPRAMNIAIIRDGGVDLIDRE